MSTVLEAEGEFPPNRSHDDLGLRVLKQRARRDRDLIRPIFACVKTAGVDHAGEAAANLEHARKVESHHEEQVGDQQREDRRLELEAPAHLARVHGRDQLLRQPGPQVRRVGRVQRQLQPAADAVRPGQVRDVV